MDERCIDIYIKASKASKSGAVLYKGDEETTPMELMGVQAVYEDVEYRPDFIVKGDAGETKEIWFPCKPR